MEERIRSTSLSSCAGRLGIVSSAHFLISTSTSGCTGSDLSGAAEDVGAFITVSGPLIGSSHPFPNDISSWGHLEFQNRHYGWKSSTDHRELPFKIVKMHCAKDEVIAQAAAAPPRSLFVFIVQWSSYPSKS
jgi:hypothetical protein